MKIKILLISLSLILTNSFTLAETRSATCSNASSNIRVNTYKTSDKSNLSHEQAVITINTVTLAGHQKFNLKISDLNLVSSNVIGVDSVTNMQNTICEKPVKTTIRQYVETISFSKRDGSPIYQDDTPESSPKSISATILCKESVTDDWPCISETEHATPAR